MFRLGTKFIPIAIVTLFMLGIGVWRIFNTLELKEVSGQIETIKLGKLCSGEGGCNEYCKNNFGRCKEHCRMHPENTLCQKPFALGVSAVGEEVFPIDSKEADKIIPAPKPSAITKSPTPIIPQIQKFEIAKPQPWVFDSITQPVLSGASKTRLTSFPAPLDKSFVEGPYGGHKGGHPEGLDHEWIGIPDDTPVLNWAVAGIGWGFWMVFR